MLPYGSNTIDPQCFRLAGVLGPVDASFSLYRCPEVNRFFFLKRSSYIFINFIIFSGQIILNYKMNKDMSVINGT